MTDEERADNLSEELVRRRFAVWQDDVKAVESLWAKPALLYARWMSTTVEARNGQMRRIAVTDYRGRVVWEWRYQPPTPA